MPDRRAQQQREAPSKADMAAEVTAVVQSVLGSAPSSDQVSCAESPHHSVKTCLHSLLCYMLQIIKYNVNFKAFGCSR